MDKIDEKIKEILSKDIYTKQSYTNTIKSALNERNYNFKKRSVMKFAVSFVVTLFATVGVVFAGVVVTQKLMDNIQKKDYEQYMQESQVTEADINSAVPENKIKETALQKLKDLGYNNEEIISAALSKEPVFQKTYWWVYTNNQITLRFDAYSGKFIEFRDESPVQNAGMDKGTAEEAMKTIQEFYNKLGFKDGDYKLMGSVDCIFENGYKWSARFNKQYDGIYDAHAFVQIDFYAGTNRLALFSLYEDKFDDNPVEISEQDAIQIAKQKCMEIDKDKEIEKVGTALSIETINSFVEQTENGNQETVGEIDPVTGVMGYHSTEVYTGSDISRRVWIVSIDYKMPADFDTYTKDKQDNWGATGRTYAVDATTGEIIGGFDVDYADYVRSLNAE